MVRPEQVAVVIPCLNEAAALPQLIPRIQSFIPSVIVIDDGSSDATGEAAAAAGAEVIRHPRSFGKGASLIEGWQRARARQFEWALAMDGDGQHAPEDIPSFLAAGGDAPLVLGDRSHQFDRMPPLRRFVNRWMSRRLSRRAGREIADTQCGFRLICLEALAGLRLKTTHFEIESEVLMAFARAGYEIRSVPIQVIYADERTKIRPLRDTWRWFRWWLRPGPGPAAVAGTGDDGPAIEDRGLDRLERVPGAGMNAIRKSGPQSLEEDRR
jgi:glycosyltransferase involved in cell wall biosynthesis